VLPLLGPSNPRDGIGRGVDTITDPLFWLTGGAAQAFSGARTYGTFSNEYGRRSGEMDSLRESSLDYYATIRSLYTQMRRSKVMNIEGDKAQEAEVDYFSGTN
jgi:phospholipid-binding lipoprotein MlaA